MSSASPTETHETPTLRASHLEGAPKPRRKRLPAILFLVTCLSTYWAGVAGWTFVTDFRGALMYEWERGLIYSACVLGILFAHEMGHFLATVIYRIPASLPFFIPFPISPIGTMGAVIGMAGHKANRRQLFDIGIAGPLAGLVIAIPVLIVGIYELDLTQRQYGPMAFDCPLLVRILIGVLRPEYGYVEEIWISQLNAYYMAAWVGLLITGLNMMPMSQLDGGHVVYALLLKRGHYVARGFLLLAIAYILWSGNVLWVLMLVLVTLMGVDHPPTADDTVELGRFRTILGWSSLIIPFLCFPVRGFLQFL